MNPAPSRGYTGLMPVKKLPARRPASRAAGADDPVVLVTGFEPFAGATESLTEAPVRGLQGFRVAGARVQALILPASYAAAARKLKGALKRFSPCAVVCFGPGPYGPILLERTARNRDQDPRPDAARKVAKGAPIDKKGPAEVASTLPLDVIRARLAAAEIPSMASDNAGGYLCNHVFYHAVRTLPPDQGVAGLIRIPSPPAKGDLAAKARNRMQSATAVRLIVGAAAERGVLFRAAAQAREATDAAAKRSR